jgi:N6-adenosine-specific RNA methylase IME4
MSSGKTFGEGGASRPATQTLNPMGISVFDRLRKVDEDKVKALAESMKEVGLITPITVRPNTVTKVGYSLITGAHRLAAAKKLKWESISAIVVEATDAESRIAEIDENLVRNELTAAERARHTAERKRLYEEIHPETKHGVVGNGREKSRKVCDSTPERFTADTAKKTGTSERKVQLDAARGEKIAGIADVIGTSLDKGEELDALAKLPISEQAILIRRAASGEKVSAKTTVKKLARSEKEEALAAKTITAALAEKRSVYGVIYADPPWRFDTYSENGMNRSAENHYPTMDLDAIKALPVPAANDCALYLWATVPMLPQALEVMAAWGFTYKSHIAWVKDRSGTGYWARNMHELLLIGTRGDVPAPAPGTQPSSVIEAPVGAHSAKPAVFAELIEATFPTSPKVELFARSARTGWAVIGNELS